MKRKTLTILFADVQGYTSRTAIQTRTENEQFVTEIRAFVEERIQEKGGVLVKAMGDGFLVTFESPTDAVACGQEMQKHIELRNANILDRNKFIRFRIGITTGEVNIDDTGDVYGDAVNIAARIQSFASPNDVFIAESTYLAMNKSEIKALDLGPQRFKNVLQEVRVYRVVQGRPDLPNLTPLPKKTPPLVKFLSTVIILGIIGAILFFVFREPATKAFQAQQKQKSEQELESLIQQNKFPAVIALAEELLQDTPDSAHLYAITGEAFLKMGDHNQAEQHLQQAIDLDRKLPDPYWNLAILYEEKQMHNEAISALGKYINKAPNEFNKKKALRMMQDLEQQQSHRKEEAQRLEQEQRDREQMEWALSNRERQLREREEEERAQREKELQEREIELNRQRSQMQSQQRQFKQQATTREKLETSQEYTQKREKLKRAIKQRNYTKATNLAEDLIKETPDNIQLHLIASDAYLTLRNYYRARIHLQKAISIDSSRTNLYAKLAIVYEQEGNYHEAIKTLQTYIKKESSFQKQEKALKRIELLKRKM